MTRELASEQVSERNCASLELVAYNDAGEPEGVYKDWLQPRNLVTCEKPIFALFSR